ncbi:MULTISPECIES: ATP-binding protein [unclassified Pseudonocardia]|jgi:two-component system sensor histidine kinase SenX3|uniref:sensor histidine kinase n=1 Tax=unclassified Pseudonocardia TaxID=2619320 RepID=UPI000961FCBA|nr:MULTISPECIES: ATP-binding protein [unclassified Pseudonocardia]MBN9100452.1 sensor histidine kinase [Pseudonocardia sp.]OJY37527.1 MAG: two-component sensor histidine kinase [Pseudonocardia sp. 73-21]
MTALVWALIAAGTLVVGFAVGLRAGRRRVAAAPVRVEPTPGPPMADLLQRVFRSTDEGLAVLNRGGDVVLHNARAAELGVVRAGQADARAAAACQKVLQTGAASAVDLSPLDHRGRQPAAVLAHVRPLGDGFTMVEAGDTSDAVRLEATRRDFVANVSHELKTPVGAMGLLAEAVLDAADDPAEVRRFGTKILNEATRLGNLVTELIALSRLTGAERLPELSVVDVDEVVREALARARLSAEAANIEIIVDRPTGLEVEGDLTLLVTALSNLVENAIAYSPPDASVSVSRRLVGGTVEIAVTDRGIGIAPEHQKRVFERFFRVDPARSRATGGTGLGLAIVKHVLANHGGDVRLWSSPGTGSTFTMRLPVREEEPDPGDGIEAPETSDATRRHAATRHAELGGVT